MSELAESTSHAIDRVIALTPLIEAMAIHGDHKGIQNKFYTNRKLVLDAVPEIDNYRTANRLDYVVSRMIGQEGSSTEHLLQLIEIGTSLNSHDGEIVDFAYENGLWSVELGIEVLSSIERFQLDGSEVEQIMTECIEALNDLSLVAMTKSSQLNTLTRNSLSVQIGKKMTQCLNEFYTKENGGLGRVIAKFSKSNSMLKELILKVQKLE